jgi:hypothetical protein
MRIRSALTLATLVPAVLLASHAASLADAASAGGAVATVRGEGRESTLDGRDVVELTVLVEDVNDLGAFAFELTFDAESVTLAAEDVRKGPFLGSTGRPTACDQPQIEGGSLTYTCVSLGMTPREGATGNGVLATVLFEGDADPNPEIALTAVQLSNPLGTEIDVSFDSGRIDVGGGSDSRTLVWIIAGVVVVALAAVGGGLALTRVSQRGMRNP